MELTYCHDGRKIKPDSRKPADERCPEHLTTRLRESFPEKIRQRQEQLKDSIKPIFYVTNFHKIIFMRIYCVN